VVTVGRLTKQKRIDLLIDRHGNAQGKGVNVPLTVIGDGPERAALEQRAAGQGLSGTVKFVAPCRPASP